MEDCFAQLRQARTCDLAAEKWEDIFKWQQAAHDCLRQGMNYTVPPFELNAEVIDVKDMGEYTQETILFNTTPWFRIKGYLLLPKNAPRPLPGILLQHEWGGPMYLGKERLIRTDCSYIQLFQKEYYDGVPLAERFCLAGYAVFCIDAFHFGERAPRQRDFDPLELLDRFTGTAEFNYFESEKTALYRHALLQLGWAGVTWAGVNLADDCGCIDYMLSRPEIDGSRLGVTGLSGGGWRTDMLLAMEPRLKAGVSVGWMTTNQGSFETNFKGAIGVFTPLPGVWNRMDIPDAAASGFPVNAMFIVGSKDNLFPSDGVDEAFRKIKEIYRRAGCPDNVGFARPDTVHCYNAQVQQIALDWFAAKL